MIKKTKIVATISDKTCTPDFIQKLFGNGMDVVRMNTAHQRPEDALKIIQDVRSVSEKIALLMDTKGPEVRTAKTDRIIKIQAGQEIMIKGDPDKESTDECIYVSYAGFVNEVPDNTKILIDDGYIELEVIKKQGDSLLCKALNDGEVKGRKGVNVPNVHFNLPCLSKRDKEFIRLAIEQDIEFIAHSFVRSKDDVLEIQKILDEHDSQIKIIAKIENQQGVDNIEEILDYAYGVMVARGDLAVEIPYEKIPGIQRELINKCIERRKPVIIATQMLHSMIQSPRPTRAEVNDVASAVYNNADAIMLSGETASGNYPVESVCTMARIATEVEKSKDLINDIPIVVINNQVAAFLIKTAVQASVSLDAKAIIADSMSGRTLRSLAAYRGAKPIFAQCYSKRTMREMALNYGVIASYMSPKDTSHEFLLEAINNLLNEQTLNKNDLIVVVAGNFGRSIGVSYTEIGTIDNLMGTLTS
ncbi:MAG: pyruvate kinase [Bacteroidales bacterium]|jgi:pyruvate kinase|nr:pyruvate kinase [Bacteroidales bacterium]